MKTRGRTDERESSLEQFLPTDELATAEEEQAKVAVNKRALSVFKSMFPGNDADERTKTVD